MNWLVHDQLILDDIDFRPDILDLRNNSTFRRSFRLPGATHKFLVVLLHTFRSHLSVFNCRRISWSPVDLLRTDSMGDFLKIVRCYRERLGLTWYCHMWVCLAVYFNFYNKEAFRDCVFQALKRWGTSRLSLCLDVLELVVWKVVIGMWAFDLYFWGGTLTVLYVTSWQSVGCQHTFPRLVAYLVVILLKSRQKQSAGWLSYRTHIGGYAVHQGPGQKNSFSIFEHFLTANGSAPLLDVTGWPCSISKKLSLSLDASP